MFSRSQRIALACTAVFAGTAYTVVLPRKFETNLTYAASAEPPKQPWQKLPNPSDKTIEKKSCTSFPNAILREDVDEKLLRLCTVSIRCMLGMCFLDRARAYAFGVYLGSNAVEQLVKSDGNLESINPVPKPEDNTQPAAAPFYPSPRYTGSREGYVFQNGAAGVGYYRDPKSTKWNSVRVSTPVLIRLVMLHNVDGEHLAHGFEKTLKSRIQPRLKPNKDGDELEQLTRFKTCLKRLESIPKGSTIDLVRSETGVLTLICDGNVLGHFDALLMGWAAVDAFFGPNGHLHNGGKQDLIQNAKSIYAVRPLTEFT